MKKYIYVIVGLFVSMQMLSAQERNWNFELSAGMKVGGATPIGFPEEIREVKGFSLGGLPAFIKVNGEYKFNNRWGIRSGVVLEGKTMSAEARVKGYKTTFNDNEDPSQNVRGYYTGDITTNVDNIYLTIPVQMTFQLGNRWNMQLGPYISYALNRRFYGKAIEGYIRNEVPTGEKVGVTDVAYDFHDSVRKIDVGASYGAKYKFAKHYHVLGQIDYGINNIMKTGFESISFGLHNVYFNLGVGVDL